MAHLLTTLQHNRALTNTEIVSQLNEIQAGYDHGRKPISEHAWIKWKHGRVTPQPVHRRVLAEWTGIPVEVLYQGMQKEGASEETPHATRRETSA